MDVLSLIIIGIILIILIIASVQIYKVMILNAFKKDYNLSNIPSSIKAKKENNSKIYFEYNFPYWSKAKKDGTADKRVKYNNINWKRSYLYLPEYTIYSRYPFDLFKLIHTLRVNGNNISQSNNEKTKLLHVQSYKKLLQNHDDLNYIVNYFSDKPTEFEKFCADLFRKMGYSAKVTPATNDGGYDIVAQHNDKKYIIECKCYSQNNKIGRPAVQKLVGANHIAMANGMIFITTSSFTKSAIEYATEMNMELISGIDLVKLLEKYMILDKKEIQITLEEWEFNISDMKKYVPSDIYHRFFLN